MRVLSFAAALVIGTTILLGIISGRRLGRMDLQQGLRASSRQPTPGRTRALAARLTIVTQVALSLVLLVGAGLLAGSLGRLRAMDKGFDQEHLLLSEMSLPRLLELTPAQELALNHEVLRRVRALPGVRAASLSSCGLFACGADPFVAQDAPAREPTQTMNFVVSPGYFESVGMPLLRGRRLGPQDHENAPTVAVINETMARRLFGPPDAALGKRLVRVNAQAEQRERFEVVGVVGDARVGTLRQPPWPSLFVPVAQQRGWSFLANLQVRGMPGRDLTGLGADIRRAVREAHPRLEVARMRAIDAELNSWLTGERILAALSGAFGLAALFLVCVGLYGVVSQWAGGRTQEIGDRMALGATAPAVAWMVLRQALMVAFAGVAVGLPAAAASSRLLEGLLFGLDSRDSRIFAGAALVMLVVAAGAAYFPARRAVRLDPMLALRSE